MPFSFQQLTISKVHAHVCSAARVRWMQPHLPAAGRLHLDALWWTAGAETSEREIHRRAFRARSSRLPSLPQASRSYDLPPPPASTRSLQMPTEQGHSTPDHTASLLPNASQARADFLL